MSLQGDCREPRPARRMEPPRMKEAPRRLQSSGAMTELFKEFDMPNATCSIAGCPSQAQKRGWCGKHYLRWHRHGDPHYVRAAVTGCRVDGCQRKTRSRSIDLCEAHYYRIRRNGTLRLRDMRMPHARYRAAHARVDRDRGKAREHACVDCGTQAQHWSYMHTDPNALSSDDGQPYSLSSEHYAPRCAPCHAAFDGTGANQHSHA